MKLEYKVLECKLGERKLLVDLCQGSSVSQGRFADIHDTYSDLSNGPFIYLFKTKEKFPSLFSRQ